MGGGAAAGLGAAAAARGGGLKRCPCPLSQLFAAASPPARHAARMLRASAATAMLFLGDR